MDFIDKKKIHRYIVVAVLFLSFGFAGWQASRGALAYLSYSNPDLKQPAWLFNDITALLAGGVIPLLFYEVVTLFAAKFATARIGAATDDMKYALRFFYIAANVIIGAVKFVYYANPVISVMGNILIDFLVTSAFFVWFLHYSAKRYVNKTRWGAMLLTVGGVYIIVEAVLVVFNIVMGVVL